MTVLPNSKYSFMLIFKPTKGVTKLFFYNPQARSIIKGDTVIHEDNAGLLANNYDCSFETQDGLPYLCNMTQFTEDDFDWTLQTGSTPSNPTGPDEAFDGGYYAFIETSNPRKANDRAM